MHDHTLLQVDSAPSTIVEEDIDLAEIFAVPDRHLDAAQWAQMQVHALSQRMIAQMCGRDCACS